MPTSSVKRVLNVPRDEQPTSKQTLVTLESPQPKTSLQSQYAASSGNYGGSPYASRDWRLRCPVDTFTPLASTSNVKRLRVFPVNPVASATQRDKATQMLRWS